MTNTVVSSGVTSTIDISGGNSATVLSGGITVSSVISSGTEYVSSGGLASATLVDAGGFLIVSAGGSATNTDIDTGGTMVLSGGAAVLSGGGGGVVVSAGAVTSGTTVNSGGTLIVSAGGVISGANVEADGTEIISSGGASLGDVIEAAGTQMVASGGLVVSATVVGTQVVDGGQVSASVINRGSELLGSGAVATSNSVLFATLTVSSGAVASATLVESESFATVSAGGTTVGDTIEQGGVEVVSSGGTVSGTTVDQHALLQVLTDATAVGVVVNGGQAIVNAGLAIGTDLSSGSLGIVAGGVASNTSVGSGGLEYNAGGTTSGTLVLHGGTESVDSAGVAAATTLRGGFQTVSSGGVARATVVSSGGAQFIFSGGVASASVISGGGVQGVNSGGIAVNTTMVAGGTLQLNEGGTATLANNVAAFGTIVFHGANAYLTVSATAPQAVISGYAQGDVIVLADLAYSAGNTVSVAGNLVTVSGPSGGGDTFDMINAGGTSYALFDDSGATGLLLAGTPPEGLALAPASDSGVPGDDITNIVTPTITGNGIAGDTVHLLNSGSVVGTGTVAANGSWSIASAALSPGDNTLTATETDPGGNVSTASTPLVIDIDTTVPPIPGGLALAASSDSGTPGDNTTDVTTPQITGSGEAGDTVSLYDGHTLTGTGTVNAGGAWAITTGTLAYGTHTLTATETNVAGNVSPSATPLSVTIAAVTTITAAAPPAPGAPALAPGSDSGVAGDDITNDTTPDITGTGVAGDSVALLDSGAVVGSGTVGSNGSWSIVSGTLAAGVHTLTATEALSGTVSPASSPLFITIDIATPVAPASLALVSATGTQTGDTTTDTTPQITGTGVAGDGVILLDSGSVIGSGTVGSSGSWAITTGTLADGSHTITATESDIAGNVSPASAALTIAVQPSVAVQPAAPAALALAAASDSGPQGEDITNVTTPAIIGTGISGDTVSLYDSGSAIGSGTVDALGSFSIVTATLAAGSHTLTATEADPGGDVSAASAPLTITIDTTPPVAPAAVALAPSSDTQGDDTTTITTPQITGTGVAGDAVRLYDGSSLVGSGTVAAGGTWMVTTAALSDGSHTLVATESDAAGNASAASAPLTISVQPTTSVQSTTPPIPASLALAPDSDSGAQGDDITNVTTPDITGTGVAGDAVSLYDGGSFVGGGTVVASGTWTVTTDTLAAGGHTLTATESDPSGDLSPASTPLVITIETAIPPAPGDVALAPASDTGVQGDDVTTVTAPQITGTGVAGDVAALYDSGAFIGSGTVQAGGTWAIATSILGDGSHTLTAVESDVAGNVSPASTPLVITIVASPATPTSLTLAPASDSGVQGDDVTNITTPQIIGLGVAGDAVGLYDSGSLLASGTVASTGTWALGTGTLAAGSHTLTAAEVDSYGDISAASSPLVISIDTTLPATPAGLALVSSIDGNAPGGTTTGNTTPEITGTGSAGETVILYDGGTAVGTGIVQGNGTWFASTSTLNDGNHTLTATETDLAANVSPASAAFTIDVDTAPPAPTDLALAPGSDSGTPGDDITDVAQPQITGDGAAGDSVVLYDGGTVVGAGTVGSAGSFEITTGSLAPGSHTLTATETDFGGHVSPSSSPLTITIQATTVAAPSTPVLSPSSDSGVAGDDITNVTAPIIIGTGVAGDVVTLSDSGTIVGTGTVGSIGSWAIVTSTLVAGSHTLSATEANPVGDVSPASGTLTLTIETALPPAPAGLALAPASDTGLQGDDITSISAPQITGIGGAGDTVTLYNSGSVAGTGTVAVNGNWTITTGTLTDATHVLTATETDIAGNVSPTSTPLSITIQPNTSTQSAPPPAPTGLALAPASDSGAQGDDITNDTTPTVTGLGTPGYTVDLYNAGTIVGTGTIAASGTWSVTTGTLASGDQSLTAIQIDLTGDVSNPSTPLTLDIDTTIPPVPTALALAASSATSAGGTITSVSTPQINGIGVAGETITLRSNGTVVGTGTVAASTTWSVTTSTLSVGSHTLLAFETDVAGNVSPASAPLVISVQQGVTIQSDAPPAPGSLALAPGSDSGVPGDDITNVTAPAITGTGVAGDSVVLYNNGTAVGTGTVAAAGTWSVSSGALGAGSQTLTATESQSFNVSTVSAPLIITIDTTIPPAPGALALAPASDSGTQGDDTTDIAMPGITGTGSAGDTVTLFDGNATLGTGTVAAGGTWAITTTTLAVGSQTLTATEADVAGNISPVANALTLTVVAVPVAPTALTLAPASDSGVQGDDITNDTTPAITGLGAVGDSVFLYDGGSSIGSGFVGANGAWSITAATLAAGGHALTATETDAYGDVSAASAALTITIDTSVPAAPTALALSPASETGGAGSNTTSVSTPLITGSGLVGDAVTLRDGATIVGTGTVGAGGTWDIVTSTLVQGSNTLTATQTDIAGNVSAASAPLGVTIAAGTTIESGNPPPPAGLALAAASNSGPPDETITNDTTPDIIGTGDAGDTITLYNGSGIIATGTVASSGSFSVIPSTPLVAGLHTLTATETNLTANTSSPSDPLIITIDTATPPAPSLAEAATVTNPGEPVLQGTAVAADTVTIYDNASSVGSAIADSAGNWTFSFTTVLAAGSYTLTAVTTDVAANASPASSVLTIDVHSDESYAAIAAPNGSGTTVASSYTSAGVLDEVDTSSASQTVSTLYDTAGAVSATVTQPGSLGPTLSLVTGSTAAGNTINLTGSSNIVVTQGDDTLLAGAGADTVFANGPATSVQGGSGPLAFFAGSGSATVTGASGSETVFGGGSGGLLTGGSDGHNVLVAGSGPTALVAGAANDLLSGAAGDDSLVLDGSDTGYAGPGAATIYGASNDLLVGGSGSDLMLATGGDDTVWAGSGSSTIFGGGNNDIVFAGGGTPMVIDGSSPGISDVVVGGSGHSTIYGGAGRDLFFATGGGATTIADGSGTDEVVFGSGPTTVTGGSGTDYYDVTAGTAGGSYVISGFKVGTDQIRLFDYGNETPQESAAGSNLTLTLNDNTRITLLNISQLAGNSVV